MCHIRQIQNKIYIEKDKYKLVSPEMFNSVVEGVDASRLASCECKLPLRLEDSWLNIP